MAGLAGFHPSKRQPLPGNEKVWQGCVILKHSLMTYLSLKEQGMIVDKGPEP